MQSVNDALAHHIIPASVSGNPAEARVYLSSQHPTAMESGALRLPAVRMPRFAPLALIHRTIRRFATPEPVCCGGVIRLTARCIPGGHTCLC